MAYMDCVWSLFQWFQLIQINNLNNIETRKIQRRSHRNYSEGTKKISHRKIKLNVFQCCVTKFHAFIHCCVIN